MENVVKNESVVIELSVKSIRVYSSNDDIRYRVQLSKPIEGFKYDAAADDFVKTEVDYIDFVPRVLIAQCLEQIAGLDVVYTKKKEDALRGGGGSGFGAAELQSVLRDAKVTLVRTMHVVGQEYTTASGEVRTYEHDGYDTSIKNIELAPKMQTMLDKVIENMFTL